MLRVPDNATVLACAIGIAANRLRTNATGTGILVFHARWALRVLSGTLVAVLGARVPPGGQATRSFRAGAVHPSVQAPSRSEHR